MRPRPRVGRFDRAASAALLLIVCTGCGKPSSVPQSPQPPAPPGGPVGGTERVGWDQQVSAGTSVSDYTFAVYVDGKRGPLANVVCTFKQGSRHHACEAPLPLLLPGTHTLQFVAIRIVDGEEKESAKSEPLSVVRAATAGAGASTQSDAPVPVDPQGAREGGVEVFAGGLTGPTDIAVGPDGRVFVAERRGTIRILQADGAAETAADLEDVLAEGDAGLQSITLHPQFSRNRWVYAAYVRAGRDDNPVFRVCRFREVAGRLGERVVLLDEVPAATGARVAVRFGPDERLYVSLGDSQPSTAAEFGSLNGKVLRLDDEGRRPDDNPLPNIVYSTTSPRPEALAVGPGGDAWTVERAGRGGLIRLLQPASATSKAGVQIIPLPFIPSAISVGADELEEGGRGEALVVASRSAEGVFRVAGHDAAPERLLNGRFGPISAVALGRDGSIFFSTDRRSIGELTPGSDYVGRIAPPPSTTSHR